MPPKGYSTLTVRADVVELIGRAKRLFHKTQIQILREAISEYIGRHYEYEAAVLSAGISDAVAVAWSAGVFEASGLAHPHPSPTMKVSVEIVVTDRRLLERLKDIWGGSIYQGRIEGKSKPQFGGSWIWSLRSEKAKRFLEATLPYMKGSKSQVVRDCLLDTDSQSTLTRSVSEVSMNSGPAYTPSKFENSIP
jgi:hypothetical protein